MMMGLINKMVTRENRTTISTDYRIKEKLMQYYNHNNWDEFFLDVLKLIEQDANSS